MARRSVQLSAQLHVNSQIHGEIDGLVRGSEPRIFIRKHGPLRFLSALAVLLMAHSASQAMATEEASR